MEIVHHADHFLFFKPEGKLAAEGILPAECLCGGLIDED
jgi:hypothetical protein